MSSGSLTGQIRDKCLSVKYCKWLSSLAKWLSAVVICVAVCRLCAGERDGPQRPGGERCLP